MTAPLGAPAIIPPSCVEIACWLLDLPTGLLKVGPVFSVVAAGVLACAVVAPVTSRHAASSPPAEIIDLGNVDSCTPGNQTRSPTNSRKPVKGTGYGYCPDRGISGGQ